MLYSRYFVVVKRNYNVDLHWYTTGKYKAFLKIKGKTFASRPVRKFTERITTGENINIAHEVFVVRIGQGICILCYRKNPEFLFRMQV